ncbi:MAG: hypothetical protein KBH21_00515 [Acetoanaerobium sp.]|nr:hypothetical protein [Acetoanaerobium sp.]
MKVREFIGLFRHFIEDKTGYTSDDTSYSDLALWEQLISTRAGVIRNLQKAKFKFGDRMFQTLPCIMLEEVDANECGIIPPSGCKILKSTCPIPSFLILNSVVNQLGTEHFDIVRWDMLDGKLQSRVESVRNSSYAAIRNINNNNFLYIFNNIHLRNIVVTAIAEDPVEFAHFCGDVDSKCNPLELDIATDVEIQDLILRTAWQAIIGYRQGALPDIMNDDTPLK